MALIHFDHVPETVKVNLPLNVIVPDPGMMTGMPVAKRKVLYLLHGLSDDASAWQRFSSIETYARLYGLVVVMPSVNRSFYLDQPNGQNYFRYITQELPQYLEDVFGLAPKREDTLIAGLSMGGYGAFKAALLHPEMYCAAASFSGALSLEMWRANPTDPRIPEFTLLFGDINKIAGSENDPATWLKRAAKNPKALPKLYIACGRQDDLYPLSIGFHKACQALGVQSEYYEEDARHEWPFWDGQIKRWLAMNLEPLAVK
jgi:S-formylglutathione hydrolase FrmB